MHGQRVITGTPVGSRHTVHRRQGLLFPLGNGITWLNIESDVVISSIRQDRVLLAVIVYRQSHIRLAGRYPHFANKNIRQDFFAANLAVAVFVRQFYAIRIIAAFQRFKGHFPIAVLIDGDRGQRFDRRRRAFFCQFSGHSIAGFRRSPYAYGLILLENHTAVKQRWQGHFHRIVCGIHNFDVAYLHLKGIARLRRMVDTINVQIESVNTGNINSFRVPNFAPRQLKVIPFTGNTHHGIIVCGILGIDPEMGRIEVISNFVRMSFIYRIQIKGKIQIIWIVAGQVDRAAIRRMGSRIKGSRIFRESVGRRVHGIFRQAGPSAGYRIGIVIHRRFLRFVPGIHQRRTGNADTVTVISRKIRKIPEGQTEVVDIGQINIAGIRGKAFGFCRSGEIQLQGIPTRLDVKLIFLVPVPADLMIHIRTIFLLVD